MSITINHSAAPVEALRRPSSQQDLPPAKTSDRLQALPQQSGSLLSENNDKDEDDDEDDFDDDLDDDSLDDFDDDLDDDDEDDDLEDDFDDDDDF